MISKLKSYRWSFLCSMVVFWKESLTRLSKVQNMVRKSSNNDAYIIFQDFVAVHAHNTAVSKSATANINPVSVPALC